MSEEKYYKIIVVAYSGPADIYLVVKDGEIVEAISRKRYSINQGVSNLEQITKKEIEKIKKENKKYKNK